MQFPRKDVTVDEPTRRVFPHSLAVYSRSEFTLLRLSAYKLRRGRSIPCNCASVGCDLNATADRVSVREIDREIAARLIRHRVPRVGSVIENSGELVSVACTLSWSDTARVVAR